MADFSFCSVKISKIQGAKLIISADAVGVHKNVVVGVFCGSGSHASFTERINLKQNLKQERLCKLIKCSKPPGRRGFALDPTGVGGLPCFTDPLTETP